MNIINIDNVEKAKREIVKSKPPVLVLAQSDVFNRKILEYGKFDVLLGIEQSNRKESIRQVDSGLNHVLAKIAARNNVSVGIDIDKISQLSKEKKARVLTRIKQNIKICRKAKAKLAIISKNSRKEGTSLLLSLGASTKQTKEALDF